MHIAFFSSNIVFSQKVLIASVEVEIVTIITKYSDFADVFSSNFVEKFPEYTGINNYFIKLIKG